ncbi:MOSC domain-containing protein [Sulfuriflexus mobilis]|uniref:MOSC domain-containing protein n=1 Tax=Sulfuriflexus mobilis TaxID=1811807 RepID=UPI0015594D40|nr:MOSC domain-containing protein [Sulfuriflexus mobilis]
MFKWPFLALRRREPLRLKAIFITASAGKPMQAVKTIQAIRDTGLQGDRYCEARGFWKSIDACQVSLITESDINKAKKGQQASLQAKLDNGGHRRNLVIDGIKTKQLQGKTFRIGTAIFSYHKPRPPCGYIEKVEGKGLCRALARNSGVCIRVVSSGTLTLGDAIEILNTDDKIESPGS